MREKTSMGFRQSYGSSTLGTRKGRRRFVGSFYVAMAISIALSCLAKPGKDAGWTWALLLLCWSTSAVTRPRKPSKYISVSNLEDRAQLQYRKGFDDLDEGEQQELLSKYRVGTYLMRRPPTAPDSSPQRQAWFQRWQRFRFLPAVLTALYWSLLLWYSRRPGPDALLKVLDPPVWLVWTTVAIVTLPIAAQLWREPDGPVPQPS